MTANSNDNNTEFWFPGRWIGGISLVLAPILMLTGALVRVRHEFFFPQQLKAYQEHPQLIATAYSLFLAGNVLLWPGVLTLIRSIGLTKPGWARWAGMFVILGLFTRVFHAGVDHLAFQLVPTLGLDNAINAVSKSYSAYHIMSAFNNMILTGWVILAIGSFLSRTLNLFQSICLASMSILMMGVLKGTSITSIIAISGLALALTPFGVRILTSGPRPSGLSVVAWTAAILVLSGIMAYTGQLG